MIGSTIEPSNDSVRIATPAPDLVGRAVAYSNQAMREWMMNLLATAG
jgi:hypothetical protein